MGNKDYKEFFGLSGPAFHKGIEVEHLFRHAQLEQWHHYLHTALAEGTVALLTGPVGSGKSTALRAYLNTLDPDRTTVVYVGYSAADRALFREMARILGLTPAFLKSDLVVQLHTAIEQVWMAQRRQTLLVIDDAHLLHDRLLIELRLLLNFQMDTATPLGLILAGQPPLREKLKQPNHEALLQRTLIRYSLAGLSRKETTEYVAAHLKAVDGDPGLFTTKALDVVFNEAKGIPRAINNLCAYALVTASWNDVRKVDDKVIEEVLRLQSVP